MKIFKKIIFVLIMAVMVVSPLSYVDAKSKKTTTTTKATTTKAKKEKKEVEYDKIKVYVFYGDGCPHCEELHEYLEELTKNKEVKNKFEVVDYEVWYNEKNSAFLTKVSDYFKHEVKGVPFYVIGEKYYDGFSEESKSEIKNAILENYGNEKYKDVVNSLGIGESDGANTEEEKTDSKSKNAIGIVILVLVAGFIVVMIIFGNKNNEEDDDDDETIEVVVEEPKKESKKTEVKEEVKKASTKKTPVKKAPAKKSSAKKASDKKTPVKKTTAKNTTKNQPKKSK